MTVFSGPILDGPWKGKSIEALRPDFEVAEIPPVTVGRGRLCDVTMGKFEVVHRRYRWDEDRGGWTLA